ncbi:MAG: hypothetical protein KF752_11990 [Pirellulaceae bacterium]|nr:hypothetical protein [Pirellulaceae bacterium]
MSDSAGTMKLAFWLLALLLAGLGIVFLIAAGQGNAVIRLVIGGVCLAAAAALVYLPRMQPIAHTHVHRMELDMPGQVSIKGFECKSCGASLDSKSLKIVSGAAQVNCPYCGSSYQLEEAPKW